jgi:hypothetical protein
VRVRDCFRRCCQRCKPARSCEDSITEITCDDWAVGRLWARHGHGPLAHRGRTNENPATGSQLRPVNYAAAVKTRPGGMSTTTRTARLVPEEHRARPQANVSGFAYQLAVKDERLDFGLIFI